MHQGPPAGYAKLLRLLLQGIFLYGIVVICSCSDSQKTNVKAEVIHQLLDSLHQEKLFNGAIVIAENDSIIFSAGYGYANFSDSIPFTIHTVADGGSLAKTLTAWMLRKLHASKKIDLKKDVQEYLPEYPYPNTTVEDLVSHNAGGLPGYDYFFPKISDTAVLTNEGMLKLLQRFRPPLTDSLHTGFNYENCGIDLAALIIEKVTGKKYEQVLSEMVFVPLGMNATKIRPARLAGMDKNRAIGYDWKNDSLVIHDIADREGFYGSCNLHFTTADLCKWGQSFYKGNLHQDIRQYNETPAIVGGRKSGLNQLNWYYTSSKEAFYYWGNVYGFYSHLYHDDKRHFTIAFMTNTTLPYALRQPLTAALTEIMESGNYRKELFDLPAYLTLNKTDDLAGRFVTGGGDSTHIYPEGNMLHLKLNDGLRYNVYLVDSITAYVPGLEAWLGLSRSSDTLALHWNSIFSEQLFKRMN
jgi:CubicO group peptidase (beta-lactamase class C family)